MELTEIKSKTEDLFSRWKEARRRYDFISDGILDYSVWIKQNPQILFLLKETKDDYYVINQPVPADKVNGLFWFNISRWRYAINESFKKIGILPIFPTNATLKTEINDIAIVDIKKTNEEKTTSDKVDIIHYAENDREFLMEQIEIINPQVIICGGTFEEYKDHIYKGEITNSDMIKYRCDGSIDSSVWKHRNRIVFYFYHPSCRFSPEELFNNLCNLIIDGKVFAKNYKLDNMYEVLLIKGGKIILKKEFTTKAEADDFIQMKPHEYSCEYQLYDMEKNEIIEEGEIESINDIIEGTKNMMDPNEDNN